MVTLRYERLFGFCRRCYSLCHEAADCLTHGGSGGRRENPSQRDPGQDQMLLTYKGAVTGG